MSCPKLPSKLEFSLFKGDSKVYIEALYSLFRRDFIESGIIFKGKPVDIIHEQFWNEKERSFWHIISSGNEDVDRNIDVERCETLPWAKALISDEGQCDKYKLWVKYNDSSKKDRYYIWCQTVNYLVILEDRQSHFKLMTAYPVEKRNVTRYQKDYDTYKNKGV